MGEGARVSDSVLTRAYSQQPEKKLRFEVSNKIAASSAIRPFSNFKRMSGASESGR